MIPGLILLVLVLILVATNIIIVPQATQFVVERLGVYSTTWNAGLHIKVLNFTDRRVELAQVSKLPDQEEEPKH